MKGSKSLKLLIIAILSILLLVPTIFITFLIDERKERAQSVINEVSQKWGGKQTVTGPFLVIPYKVYSENKDSTSVYSKSHVYFMPETLNIDCDVNTSVRYRSIFEVIVFQNKCKIKGTFPMSSIYKAGINPEYYIWEEARLFLGISDLKGISKEIEIKLDGRHIEMYPDKDDYDLISSGLSTKCKIQNSKNYFEINLSLNGTGSLMFLPVGKTTKVTMKSNWNAPSFTGEYLPDYREIQSSGFKAKWKILSLNRNYPQHWFGGVFHIGNSAFGTDFVLPVDNYQITTRAVKYAIMFIVLTFAVFFLMEILYNKPIHPIQYLMVGLALSLFYTLLLSLTEQMNFIWAYTVSALATILLITLYSRTFLRKIINSISLAVLMVFLYSFLYAILQLENYSLMLGSLGLFLILAIIMYASRKIDWYSPIIEEKYIYMEKSENGTNKKEDFQ